MAALVPGAAVVVRTPASSANLGPGFDSVGLALGLEDECEVRLTGDRLVIDVTGEGAGTVPGDARHLVYRCLARGLAQLGYDVPAGLSVRCHNVVPHSRGLGSSATAAVTGFAAASALDLLTRHGRAEVDLDWVNELAAQAEGHPDNSSASVYGGMTVSWSDDVAGLSGVHTARLSVHEELVVLALVPDIELSTAAARAALPTEVPLKHAALNAGRTALLVEAMTRRPELLLAATRDWLHQEQRRIAYPDTMRVVDALRAAGHAACVSGAGPTVLVLSTSDRVAAAEEAATAAIAQARGTWRTLRPQVPRLGVTVRPGVEE